MPKSTTKNCIFAHLAIQFLMVSFLWNIILGYIFVRPFICATAFVGIEIALDLILAISLFLLLRKKRLEKSIYNKLILLYFLSILISAAFSTNIPNSLSNLHIYLIPVLLFYAATTAAKETKRSLLTIISISAIAVCLYSLYSFFFTSKQVMALLSKYNNSQSFAIEYLSRNRAFSPFFSPNLLASYTTMIALLSLGTITHHLHIKKYGISLKLSSIALFLSIVVLALTQSIGGWLSFMMCLLLFYCLGKKSLKSLVFILLSAVILIAAMFILRHKTSVSFTHPLFSIESRILYWRDTLSLILEHPIKGVGIGNFQIPNTIVAHNSYLQLWAETGILGLISILLLVFFFIKEGAKNITSNENKFIYLGVFTAGIAFLLHNTIDYSFFIPQVSFLWWVVLGLNHAGLGNK